MSPNEESLDIVPAPKPGPKPIAVTDKDCRIIEDMAGRGAKLDDIARVIGVSPSTLDRWMANEEVRWAYDTGIAKMKDALAKSLFDMALDGDVTAAIWLEKSRFGYTDKQKEDKPKGDTRNVVVFLPDNMRGDRIEMELPAG